MEGALYLDASPLASRPLTGIGRYAARLAPGALAAGAGPVLHRGIRGRRRRRPVVGPGSGPGPLVAVESGGAVARPLGRRARIGGHLPGPRRRRAAIRLRDRRPLRLHAAAPAGDACGEDAEDRSGRSSPGGCWPTIASWPSPSRPRSDALWLSDVEPGSTVRRAAGPEPVRRTPPRREAGREGPAGHPVGLDPRTAEERGVPLRLVREDEPCSRPTPSSGGSGRSAG